MAKRSAESYARDDGAATRRAQDDASSRVPWMSRECGVTLEGKRPVRGQVTQQHH
jgi:hypothetical protein